MSTAGDETLSVSLALTLARLRWTLDNNFCVPDNDSDQSPVSLLNLTDIQSRGKLSEEISRAIL